MITLRPDAASDPLLNHAEIHRSHRVGWLRAAVLGANDGIVSTASLIIGVAEASTEHAGILLAGVAGLVAGAMSMAAGEYVSVSSQSDTERADLKLVKDSLEKDFAAEQGELARIYEARGLDKELAAEVARQLMAHDALGAHARDEIGISHASPARPIQAALSSAAAFMVGALLPLAVAYLVPGPKLSTSVAVSSLVFLALLGAVAARTGGASMITGALRVTFWSALAMVLSGVVGRLFDVVV
jgi:VIT1/CCC1 family predicted Fe2+/Mn2+ transporter